MAATSDPVRNLCIRYNEVLLSQARVTAACNALHSIEARFCRWLLQSADRAASDTSPLTQEFLAEMLGVRRTSVTEVASKVQSAGVITYSRGVIRILDRAALMRMSCECYETLVDQSADAGLTGRARTQPLQRSAGIRFGLGLPVLVFGGRRCLGADVLGVSVLRTLPQGSVGGLGVRYFLQRFP